jgi:hypothetical protein
LPVGRLFRCGVDVHLEGGEEAFGARQADVDAAEGVLVMGRGFRDYFCTYRGFRYQGLGFRVWGLGILSVLFGEETARIPTTNARARRERGEARPAERREERERGRGIKTDDPSGGKQ